MDDRMTSEVVEKKIEGNEGESEFIFCLLEEFDANFC